MDVINFIYNIYTVIMKKTNYLQKLNFEQVKQKKLIIDQDINEICSCFTHELLKLKNECYQIELFTFILN